MLTVRLHGHLEEKFGSEFRFEATTIREVVDALQANFDDFTEEFIKDQRAYSILVDAEAQEIHECFMPIRSNSTIDIVPVIGGAGFLKSVGLIILAVLIVIYAPALLEFMGATGTVTASGAAAGAGAVGSTVSATAAAVAAGSVTYTAGWAAISVGIQALGMGLALAGVASLLAGPDGPDGGGAKSSSLNQAENIVGQGMPIPVGYGRLMIGSLVLSSTSSSSYTKTSKAWTYENTLLDRWQDKHMNIGPAEDIAGGTTLDDGYTVPLTVYPGYTDAQLANLESINESYLGGGSYQLINVSTPTGTTVVSTYVPPQFYGSYDKDLGFNHRINLS